MRLCVLVLVLTTKVAFAQSPPRAATVLANVQHFYASAHQLTAAFRQTFTNATFNKTTPSDGRVWVLKPSDVRWDYFAKRSGAVVITKSFIFDGKTVWMIDHGNKQIVQSQPQSSVVPAAVSFLTGGTALTSQFTVAISTSGTYGGKGTVVLALTPKQPSAAYHELYFVVDPADWHVKESVVIASNGDTNQFSFYTPDLATAVNASVFTVNPATLPGYKLVKLKP